MPQSKSHLSRIRKTFISTLLKLEIFHPHPHPKRHLHRPVRSSIHVLICVSGKTQTNSANYPRSEFLVTRQQWTGCNVEPLIKWPKAKRLEERRIWMREEYYGYGRTNTRGVRVVVYVYPARTPVLFSFPTLEFGSGRMAWRAQGIYLHIPLYVYRFSGFGFGVLVNSS